MRWHKRLKTRYKSREFRVYTLVSCDGSMFLLDINIRTKSKRKRGKHEVRLETKRMKKARLYWESQGYKFKRKSKIIRCPKPIPWMDYCFVNMDGRIRIHYPIRIKSKRKRGAYEG